VRIYRQIEEILSIKNAVVTIGTFDGVHKAHQAIIKRLLDLKADGETVLITFFPHPKMVLGLSKHEIFLLQTLSERIQAIQDAGIDHLLIIPFTKEFAELSAEEFTQQILIDRIGTKKMILGYDHHFGKNRVGGFDFLKANEARFGFEVEEIPRQEIDETTISSSNIRNALMSGELAIANELLGYPFQFSGEVVKGKQLGRTIGYPTANILIEEKYKLIPQNGVFAVKIHFKNEEFKGMLNIGIRPTVNGLDRTIEVNIFDFDQEIYGENLKVDLVAFIRNEQKFDGLEALKAQLLKDKELSISLLKKT
jgi:riboflavin kinase / FMN adenylyltransferase